MHCPQSLCGVLQLSQFLSLIPNLSDNSRELPHGKNRNPKEDYFLGKMSENGPRETSSITQLGRVEGRKQK